MAVDYATLKKAALCDRSRKIIFRSGFGWSAVI